VKPLWKGILIGGGVAAIGLWAIRKANAASKMLPAPTEANLFLLPGGTAAVAVKNGGGVTFHLPTGATWASSGAISPVNAAAAGYTAPTGAQAFRLVMNVPAGTIPAGGMIHYPIAAKWTDASGASQSETVDVQVSA
jgi:hypothetical protein